MGRNGVSRSYTQHAERVAIAVRVLGLQLVSLDDNQVEHNNRRLENVCKAHEKSKLLVLHDFSLLGDFSS